MTRSYVRYSTETGLFLALMTMENHYPEPQPRSAAEAIIELTDEQYRSVTLAPNKWNYADGTVTPLFEGRLSVSSLTFYTDVEGFEELYPDLDNVVEMQPQFPGLPVDEPIRVRVNATVHDFPNYGTFVRLKSNTIGIFSVTVVDTRVSAETPTFYINCVAAPEITNGA